MQGGALLAAVKGAAHRLAVDGDLSAGGLALAKGGAHPAQKAALESLGIDQHQHPPERVVGGNAARQLDKPSQPLLLATAVEGDILEALGPRKHGADRNDEDVHEPVLNLGCATRVLQRGEVLHQLLDHRLLTPS
jgi:hypothetical protein